MPKKAKNSKSTFVTEKLVDFAAGANSPVYSDMVYGYLKDVVEEYGNTQNPKLLPKMIGKVSGGSPYSPSALAFEYGADEIGLQVEYEFSKRYIIKTVLDVVRSYEGDGLSDRFRSEVRRDVITGSFTYKNGKLRGVADSILHGVKEYGEENREYFRAIVPPNGVRAGSLSSLRESGSAFGSFASADVLRDSLSSYAGAEFFSGGWSDSPFAPNLI
jgi:hypothetical protein